MPMTVSPEFTRFCARNGIRVDDQHPVQDAIVLKGVPVNGAILSKPRTNLCVVRDAANGFLVWVDSDLCAQNPDCPAARMLTGTLNGSWQRVAPAQPFRSAEDAVYKTVQLLSREPAPQVPKSDVGLQSAATPPALLGKLLPMLATDLAQALDEQNLIGRERLLESAGQFIVHGRKTLVFAGPSGSGLTSCALRVINHRLATEKSRAVRVDCGLIATEMVYPASTDERFRQLLAECQLNCQPPTWFLLDNVQWPLRSGALAQAALAAALERGLQCVCTCQTDLYSFGRLLPMLARRMHWVELPALDLEDLSEILRQRADILTEEFDVSIDPQTLRAVIAMAGESPGSDPARVLDLLESAVSLASDGGVVGPDEVAIAARLSTASRE